MSKENEEKAVAFLEAASRQRPYNYLPVPPLGNYWLVKREKWFGFTFGRSGPLIAVCSIRLMQFKPIPIAQYFYICVDSKHRGHGLAQLLLDASLGVCDLVDENRMFRYCLASMPDGEPGFVRRHLIRLGCKSTKGFNTDALPMLYFRHPLFVGDDSFVERNYLLEPPDEHKSEL